MRKLTYDIYTKNGAWVSNVTTFDLANEAKAKGYEVKEKMRDIKETLVYDCYKDGKLVKTVKLNKDKAEAKMQGFEIKTRYEYKVI